MHPELFYIPGTHFPIPSYGAMVLISFLGGTWWMAQRARRVKADPDVTLNIALISLITSTIGARTFYVVHYWDQQFADNPRRIFDIQQGGFEIYGGLIAAFVCSLLYGLIRRLPARIYADCAAPSILLGMGIGRIGCFLFGCCWGSPCPDNMPWAVQFPYGSPVFNRQWEGRQVTVPAELLLLEESGIATPIPNMILKMPVTDLQERMNKAEQAIVKAKAAGDQRKIERATHTCELLKRGVQPLFKHYESFHTTPTELKDAKASHLHTLSVHPSQIYGAVGPILLALITNAWFYRRKHHGTVMPLGFMLYAVERFIEEAIRSDNPHDTFGLTIAQGISVGIFVTCVLTLLIILKMPPHATNVKPWQPPAKNVQAPV